MGCVTITPSPCPLPSPLEVTEGPYLAAVHSAFQVSGTDHGGGDDTAVHIPVVADLVGD